MKTNKTHSGKKERGLELVFLMTIGVLLGFSAFSGILHTGGFEQSQLRSLIQMFLVIAAFRLLLSSKYLVWGCAGLLTIGLAVFAFTSSESSFISETIEFITAVIQYVGGYGDYNTLYEQTFIWLLCALLGLFIVLFVNLYPNFILSFVMFAAIFGVLISSYTFNYFFLFYIFIFCILVCLIKQLNLSCINQRLQGTPFLCLALPLAILCVLLAGFIPLPQGDFVYEALQVDFIESLRRTGEALRADTHPPYFGIQQTGFGDADTRRLGGNVTTDDRLFMRIHTDAPQPIYLTGVTMDTYTGYGWENQLREYTPLDFDELYANLSLYESFAIWFYHQTPAAHTGIAGDLEYIVYSTVYFEEAGRIIDYIHRERTIMIGGLNRPIYTVFYPGLIQSFEAYDAEFVLLQEQSGQVITRELMPRDTWYTLTYFPLHGFTDPHDSYPGILRELAARFESGRVLVSVLIHGQARIDFRFVLQNYLIPRADWIHKTYTTLPEEFPTRIGERARSITAEAENNYTRARLLETYLRTQFTYSLTPGTPPPDRDFVDYFLFDSRTGYCTYFATAFVTMARSLDIPARYVEGFLVSGALPDEQGFLHVQNSMGHAWGEVYLEGYGWLRFEPTPPEDIIQHPINDDPEIETESEIDEPSNEPQDERQDNLLREEFPEIPERPDFSSAAEQEDLLQGRLWLIPTSIALFLILLLSLRMLWVYTQRRKVRKWSNREAVCYYFSILLKYLQLFGFEMQNTETVFQFYERVADEALFPKESVEIYAKAYYSNVDISLEERRRMEQEAHRIEEAVQSRRGKWRYLLHKYL